MSKPMRKTEAEAQDRPGSPPLYGPFAEVIDYRLDDWAEDYAAVTLEVGERHMNRSGVIHGGVLTTLIDTACGSAGCYRPPPQPGRRAVTLALTAQFIGPVRIGAYLAATARRTGGGRQFFFAHCELHDRDGRLVATGDGTFKYRRETD